VTVTREIPGASSPGGSASAATPDAVTVNEVRRVVLPGSRVIGGSAGMLNRVSWATALRSRPPAYELRGGGEFVLAGPAALEGLHQIDASLTLERILEGLSQAGAAALAVPGPIPARARAAANAHSIPLIELPPTISLHEAERGIIGLVLDRHNELQARASEFYRRLAQISVEGRGVEAIVADAARVAHRLVTLEDAAFRLRAFALPPQTGSSASADDSDTLPAPDEAGLSSADERARLNEQVRSHPVNPTTPAAYLLPAARLGLQRYAAAVYTRERLRGFVSLCGPPETLTEFDQLAVSRAAAICALELAKEDAVLAAEQRVQRDLLDELLTGGGEREVINRRAAQAGMSEAGPFVVAFFSAHSAGGPDADGAAIVGDALTRHAARGDLQLLVRIEGSEVAAVCDLSSIGNDGDSADARLRRLREDLALATGGALPEGRVLNAGFSRPHDGLGALPAAALEAREALRIGRRVHGEGAHVGYADLGLYRVLHSLRESSELRLFYEQTLGPLVEYDRKTGQSYVETLETYFACHGNLSQTAQRLHHHRNSLLYRIGRIQEICGVDLEDAEARLSLQVALKARRLLVT
jgi:PucR family transcriptional regulator, purine catabolism regulatory protein